MTQEQIEHAAEAILDKHVGNLIPAGRVYKKLIEAMVEFKQSGAAHTAPSAGVGREEAADIHVKRWEELNDQSVYISEQIKESFLAGADWQSRSASQPGVTPNVPTYFIGLVEYLEYRCAMAEKCITDKGTTMYEKYSRFLHRADWKSSLPIPANAKATDWKVKARAAGWKWVPSKECWMKSVGEWADTDTLQELFDESRSASQPGVDTDNLRASIAEILKEREGYWQTCTGCHESEDGHDVGHYPFSDTFQCKLGSGCHECGGIGAVWEHYPVETADTAPSLPPDGVQGLVQALDDFMGWELDMHLYSNHARRSFEELKTVLTAYKNANP